MVTQKKGAHIRSIQSLLFCLFRAFESSSDEFVSFSPKSLIFVDIPSNKSTKGSNSNLLHAYLLHTKFDLRKKIYQKIACNNETISKKAKKSERYINIKINNVLDRA